MMHSLYEYSYAMEEGLAVLSGLFSGIPSMALGIASYVLTALALYTVAKRRAIRGAWMAWIPVVNVWLLGSISDQYRYVVKGQIKSRRKVLLILRIVLSALCTAAVVAAAVMVFRGISAMMYDSNVQQTIFHILGTILGVALPLAGVSIAYAVLYFIALYDVYTSLNPENSALFLVLSILFPVTEAFFLFFNRNKDLGMPPRREERVYTSPEPWETDNKDYL